MKTRSSAQQNIGAQLNLEDSFASAESESEIDNMTFDTENGVDEAGAHSKLSSVKVSYDQKDLGLGTVGFRAFAPGGVV